jgi:CheY-like chemotaxis protein
MADSVRVVVVDDHFVTREGLRRLLDEQPNIEVVGCAGDPDSAMQLVQRLRPDVLITDIRMSPTNTTEGVELAHAVRGALPGCGVVVLSQHDDEQYIWSLFEDGECPADCRHPIGHVLKAAALDDLIGIEAIAVVVDLQDYLVGSLGQRHSRGC